MALKPLEIKRVSQQALAIRWSDGSRCELSNRVLRTNCPCATCREARGDSSHSTPLGGLVESEGKKKGQLLRVVEHSVDEELRLEEIWGVGNYAIGVRWGDGHRTGIYTFHYLEELCRAGSATARESAS